MFWLKKTSGDLSRVRKLCSSQVLEIRSLQGKKSAKDLAAKYKVSPSTIRAIWARKKWRDI